MNLPLPCISTSRVWVVFFLYATTMALMLKLIALPILFRELHAGHGLLMGGDWVGFHSIAEGLAEEINVKGWSAWELRPLGHSPAGIAAAIYALTVAEPFVLVPLNAAIHATAGVALMRIARYLTDDDFAAMCAALPFVIFPSAMAWYGQIGKDGFYFAGAFLCLYGWINLARIESWQSGWRPVCAGLAWLSLGVALMGMVRIYSFQVMQGMGTIFAVGLSVLFIVRGAKGGLPWKSCAAAIAILFMIPLLLMVLPTESRGSAELLNETRGSSEFLAGESGAGAAQTVAQMYWRQSDWLPSTIDTAFLRLAVLREGYLSAPAEHRKAAGSNIDMDVRISSAVGFVMYLPRAIQIGLLAPFPRHWIATGYSPGGSLMRRMAGGEMIVVYFSLLFLPYALWHWRNRVEIWLSVTFGTVMVLLYAFVTPNIGTIYRLRYGFVMLLVGIGILAALTAWRTFFSGSIRKSHEHQT
jgi:hypothetical protein